MEKLSIGKGEVTPSLAAPPSRKENWRWGGGRGGIRTHGSLATTPDFESGAFNHSATLPIYEKFGIHSVIQNILPCHDDRHESAHRPMTQSRNPFRMLKLGHF